MAFELHTGTAAASRVASLPKGIVVGPDFFARASDEVAQHLIGKILWSPGIGGGRLTEVEAYLPSGDPASHAARGPTRRNAAMFGRAGTVYVFLSYGVHYLLNLVCEPEGIGSAVLIRAVEALEVPEAARGEAGGGTGAASISCSGPGRVGTALKIHPDLNGVALGAASGLFVLDDGLAPEVDVDTRIGISRGDALPLRYYARGSKCVTRRSRSRKGPCT